jgi:hypothetical protein
MTNQVHRTRHMQWICQEDVVDVEVEVVVSIDADAVEVVQPEGVGNKARQGASVSNVDKKVTSNGTVRNSKGKLT